MKLKSVQIHHFKHVLDSTVVNIQNDITCLVGKNESGKTAFLEALRRLKPAQGGVSFCINKHYPAWLEKMHRKQGRDLEKSRPIKAEFELDDSDVAAINDIFGEDVLTSRKFGVSRQYDNSYHYDIEVGEAIAVSNFLNNFDLPPKVEGKLANCATFPALSQSLSALKHESSEDQQITTLCSSIQEGIAELLPEENPFKKQVWEILFERLPRFFFYSDYSCLPGRVRIRELLEANAEDLNEDDQTALSLLQLAGSDQEYLLIQTTILESASWKT